MNPPKVEEDFVKEGAQKVTEQDLEKVVTKSEEIKRKFSTKGALARFVQDGQLLLAVIKDYRAGIYRNIPYGTITAIAFTLIYVLNPFDIVPDVLPVIGQIDDAAVISACLLLVEQDLHKYKNWKQS